MISRRSILSAMATAAATAAIDAPARAAYSAECLDPMTDAPCVPRAGWIDHGVTYAEKNFPLIRVESEPCRGQYSFDDQTGTYTFSDADVNEVIDQCFDSPSHGEAALRFRWKGRMVQLLTSASGSPR